MAEEELSYSIRMKVAEEDIKNLKAELSQVTKAIEQQGDVISASLEDSFGNIQGMVGKVASLVGVGFGVEQVKAFAQQVFNVRSKMQDLNSTMTTFLGSEEKAAKFTEELSNYAYWNMFEFDELAEASSELMAYGTKTEEIIGVLDQLSNVASGTKRSIGELTAMYNRAKSQGFLDSRQMLSLASMTGSTPQELKELAGEAESAQLSFEGLTIALEKLTGEGGKFNNLMLNQMDNLSASYGQLQDNITNAMNEIGENLQDYFKGAIDFAGKMVENYEKIGIAIGTLIAIYGEYKAVLMVINALQKASVYVEAGKKLADNIKLVMMFRKELGLLTAAQQAFNLKAMANPYVLLAGAVIGVTTAILGLAKATEDNRTESEKINDTYNDTVRGIEDQTRVAKKYLAILEDETASLQSQKEAREELNKMNLFKGQNEDGDVINKAFDKSVLTASIEDLKNYVNEAERIIKEGASVIRKEDYEMKKASKLNDIINADRLGSQKKEIDKAVKSYNELAEGQYSLREAEIRALPTIDAKTKAIEADSEALSENNYVLINQINHLNAKKKLNNDEVKELIALKTQYESNMAIMKHYNKLLQEMNAEQLEQEKGDVTLSELHKKLREQETKVEAARKKYAQTGKKQDKDELEREKSSLDNMMKLYQTYTNKKWVLDKDYYKTVLELQKENAKAWEDLENSKIKKKGELARKQLKVEIDAINEQEKEFRRNNNGRTSGVFTDKKNIVSAKFEQSKTEAGNDIIESFNDIIRNNKIYANENDKVLDDIRKQTEESLKAIEKEWEDYASFFENLDDIPASIKKLYNDVKDATSDNGNLLEYQVKTDNQEKFWTEYLNKEVEFKHQLEDIQKDDTLSQERKDKLVAKLQMTHNFDVKDLTRQIFGTADNGEATGLIQEVQNTLNMGLEELIRQADILGEELDKAAKVGGRRTKEYIDIEKRYKKVKVAIKAVSNETEKLSKEEEAALKKAMAWEAMKKVYSDVEKALNDVAEAMGDNLSDEARIAIESCKNITNNVISLVDNINTFVNVSIEGMKAASTAGAKAIQAIESASVILAIISAVIQIVMAVKDAIQSIVDSKKAVEAYQEEVRKLNIEMERSAKNFERAYGTDNWQQMIANVKAIEQYGEEIGNTEKKLKKLEKTSYGFFGNYNVLKNKRTGNAVMDIPVKFNIEGRKGRFLLSDAFPNLFNEDGSLNVEQAKLFTENDKMMKALPKKYREMFKEIVSEYEQYNSVVDEYTTYWSDMFGDLGDSIADAIIQGFKEGEDASESFAKVLDKIVENYVTDMLKTQKLIPILDEFNEEANKKKKEVLEKTGDKDAAERAYWEYFIYLLETGEERLTSGNEAYLQYLNKRQEEADELLTATAGGFESMSQDTAEELNGRFTALQIYGYEINQNVATISMDIKQVANIQSDIRYQLELNQDIMQDMMQNVREINANTSHLLQMKNDLATIKSRL